MRELLKVSACDKASNYCLRTKLFRQLKYYGATCPKVGFTLFSAEKSTCFRLIFKKLLHLHEELFFFTTAYLYLHAIAHYNSSTFTPHIFLDMHEINKKRFMYTKKNSISQ